MTNEAVSAEIKTRGYWRIVIRPEEFVERRIESTPKLIDVLRSTALHIRGWDFPHVSENPPPKHLSDSVETSVLWGHYLEYWKFYLSGQFAGLKAVPIDWREMAPEWWQPIKSDPKVEKLFPVGDAIARITEIFEFAGRLSKSPAGASSMLIDVSWFDLNQRALKIMPYDNRTPFIQKHTCQVNDFRQTVTATKDDLASSSWELAIPVAQRLFNSFGWDPSAELIREWQRQMLKK